MHKNPLVTHPYRATGRGWRAAPRFRQGRCLDHAFTDPFFIKIFFHRNVFVLPW